MREFDEKLRLKVVSDPDLTPRRIKERGNVMGQKRSQDIMSGEILKWVTKKENDNG